MKKTLTIVLALLALVCFGAAIWYPISYNMQQNSNESTLEKLRAMRDSGLESTPAPAEETERPGMTAEPETEATAEPAAQTTDVLETITPSPSMTPEAEPTASPEPESSLEPGETMTAVPVTATPSPTPEVTRAPTPTPTIAPTREPYEGALAYPNMEKTVVDESQILPQYREIYKLNRDLVGWLRIDGIGVDHPVLQNEDDEYYLHHDFNGDDNSNGQFLIFNICDPFTPSYNVVISGHNMKSGKMFGHLAYYKDESFWEKNKTFQFDTLLEEKQYVVVAAFYSANYDEDEEGFRYLADIQYPIDYRTWIDDVRSNALYDTGIDTEFGDEFLTLTTCAYQRKNGRFVVIARRIREGEIIE